MSQLQSVLRRSIAHLDPDDRDSRRRVFASARSAMVRLLFSYDPPLTTSEINRKIGEFDRIVGEIESGHAPYDGQPPSPATPSLPSAANDRSTALPDPSPAEDESEPVEFQDDFDYDDEDYPDDGYRPSFRDRLLDWAEALTGQTIALIAAAAVAVVLLLLAGGLLISLLSGGHGSKVAAVEPPVVEQPAAAAPIAAPPGDTAPAPSAPVAAADNALALQTLVLFDGRDPTVFQSAPDNPVQFSSDADGGYIAVHSATVSTGARIVVGRGIYQQLAGRRIRIVVVARGSKDGPATSLRFAYQNGRAVSPWIDLPLSSAYLPQSGEWTVPKNRGGPESDALIIEPGIPGDGTSADIKSVRLEVLG